MVSKESFVKIMKALEKQNDMMEGINRVFRKYNDDSVIMSCSLEGAVIDFIQEQFDDTKDDWLGYLCYDKNYLHDYELGDIQLADGSDVELNEWGDVYDFLVQCMNDKNSGK